MLLQVWSWLDGQSTRIRVKPSLFNLSEERGAPQTLLGALGLPCENQAENPQDGGVLEYVP